MNHNHYSYKVIKLSKTEGGGYLIEYPDLPGCISYGDTEEEALRISEDAVKCWLATAQELGRKIPEPTPTRKN